MRINSRRWQASILLVLAIVIGTSALSSLQHRRPLTMLNGSAGSFFEITATQISGAANERSLSALPGTHDWFVAADHHFDVEGSRADWQPTSAGLALIPSTEQLGASVFSGIQPTQRVALAAPFLSRSARARN
jgi:hypothetical protein